MDVDKIAANVTFRALGKPATYIPTRGTVVQTRVILDKDVQTIGELGLVVQQVDTMDIPAADIPRPVLGSVIRLEGQDWRIDTVDTRENEVIQVIVVQCPSA